MFVKVMLASLSIDAYGDFRLEGHLSNDEDNMEGISLCLHPDLATDCRGKLLVGKSHYHRLSICSLSFREI